jgi:outer membrane receptor for Fe3+-dicitrate
MRDLAAGLWSNALSTPIIAAQDRGLREAYVKASVAGHFGRHEWKAGADGEFGSIEENLSYRITDRSRFDRETARRFQFAGRAQDREQAAFVQDLLRLGNWTLSAGLRFDHYGLVVDESAFSPRAGVAYYWPSTGLVLRASYDRVFQTPAFENLLLASSAAVDALNDSVLRLPVHPSHGNFYEAGLAKGILGKLRLEANYFRRAMDNFADDDLLLNTGVSFPIAFRKAAIYGAEVKLEIPRWGPVSGYLSYSNLIGRGTLPVTGGLFLGDEASGLLKSGASFPITQDQRNTVRARFRYEITKRVWTALGGSYGSGLPVEFEGTYQDALAQYGPRIVSRVNFDRGRVRPSFSLDASAGIILRAKERHMVRLQADVQNMTGRLNVLDFSGLFSGTALAAPRSAALRLQAEW